MNEQPQALEGSPFTIWCASAEPYPACCTVHDADRLVSSRGIPQSLLVVLRDRWRNRTGLAGKSLQNLRVIIRHERQGEVERAQERHKLLIELCQLERELAKKKQERAMDKAGGFSIQKLTNYEQTKTAATLSTEIERIKKRESELIQSEEWLTDNAEEQQSAENVELSVLLHPSEGYSIDFCIKEKEEEEEGKYVMMIKLDGEHIANSPLRITLLEPFRPELTHLNPILPSKGELKESEPEWISSLSNLAISPTPLAPSPRRAKAPTRKAPNASSTPATLSSPPNTSTPPESPFFFFLSSSPDPSPAPLSSSASTPPQPCFSPHCFGPATAFSVSQPSGSILPQPSFSFTATSPLSQQSSSHQLASPSFSPPNTSSASPFPQQSDSAQTPLQPSFSFFPPGASNP